MAKYNKTIAAKICQLIREDSYTIAEICKIVGICKDTYHEWVNTKPEFSDSIKKAKEDFNTLMVAEARRSLLKLVRGYSEKEERTVTLNGKKQDENGNPISVVKEHTVTTKHFQPNPTAIIFTLVNRDPDNWKNKMDNNVTGEITLKSELDKLSDEELENIIKNGEASQQNDKGSEKT